MRPKPSSHADQAEVDMTPMIDIVFQLISFFMMISNFEQTKADERVKLPKDSLAKPPEVKVENELVLNIGFIRDTDGNKLDPDPFIFYAGDERIRVQNFGPKLHQEQLVYKSQKRDPADVSVVLRADADVPTGLVQELISTAQQEGFSRFAIKATQKRE